MKSEKVTWLILVAVFSVFFGLILAFYWDFPASGTIVLLAAVIFFVFFLIKRVRESQ